MNTCISKRCNSLHNARRLKGQLQNATALSICPPRHPESVVSPSMFCCAPSNTRACAQCPRTVKCACSGGNQQEPHCTEYCAGVNLQRRPAQKVRPQTLHCTRASPSGECVVHQSRQPGLGTVVRSLFTCPTSLTPICYHQPTQETSVNS